jgi:quinol monooxygenase YgiN
MATMIVKHRVASFDSWKAIFDEMELSRREHGWTGHEVYRDAADPSTVVIVNHMRDLDSARARARERIRSDLMPDLYTDGIKFVSARAASAIMLR